MTHPHPRPLPEGRGSLSRALMASVLLLVLAAPGLAWAQRARQSGRAALWAGASQQAAQWALVVASAAERPARVRAALSVQVEASAVQQALAAPEGDRKSVV